MKAQLSFEMLFSMLIALAITLFVVGYLFSISHDADSWSQRTLSNLSLASNAVSSAESSQACFIYYG